MTSAVILGMIVTMFPEPREQAKAIGVYSFVASAGASIGLLAGGVLTQAHHLALDLLRQRPDRHRDRACSRCGCSTHEDGLGLRAGRRRARRGARHRRADARRLHDRRGRRHGWGSAHTLGLGAVALALLAASSPARRPPPTPLLPLRLFRSRNVSGANVIQMLMVAGLFGMFFLGVALPAARARLRRDRDRPGVPARVASASACSRSASRRG